jgi:hypothetical protein
VAVDASGDVFVTDATNAVFEVLAGRGRDWFFFRDAKDRVALKSTDLLNSPAPGLAKGRGPGSRRIRWEKTGERTVPACDVGGVHPSRTDALARWDRLVVIRDFHSNDAATSLIINQSGESPDHKSPTVTSRAGSRLEGRLRRERGKPCGEDRVGTSGVGFADGS